VDSCAAADPLLAGVAAAPGDDRGHASLLPGSRYGKPFERRMITDRSVSTDGHKINADNENRIFSRHAWFRLLDSARVSKETEVRSELTFTKDGHEAQVRLEAASVRNPFNDGDVLRQFRWWRVTKRGDSWTILLRVGNQGASLST
jgi:hypothetical protein